MRVHAAEAEVPAGVIPDKVAATGSGSTADPNAAGISREQLEIAAYNVRINLKGFGPGSADFVKETGDSAARLLMEAETISDRIRAFVRDPHMSRV